MGVELTLESVETVSAVLRLGLGVVTDLNPFFLVNSSCKINGGTTSCGLFPQFTHENVGIGIIPSLPVGDSTAEMCLKNVLCENVEHPHSGHRSGLVWAIISAG